MKKKIAALAAVVVLAACLFTGCNRTDSGKVTGSSVRSDPVITTNAATDATQGSEPSSTQQADSSENVTV